MTQASLSPDLQGALGAPPSTPDASTRSGVSPEAALWMTALTSVGLVLAALLLLGLLMRNAVADPSLSGFVAGIGIVIAALGVGGVSYALVTARRAGYLEPSTDPKSPDSAVAPAGMHVVPAVPPDLGQRKRRQLEAERSSRSRQAKAIATAATVAPRQPAPMTSPRPAPRPVAPPRTVPRPPQQSVVRSVPTSAARPQPPRPVVPVRVAVGPPVRPQMRAHPPITMPRSQMQTPRPAAWPNQVPVVRMAAPPMRPRTQVATYQVNAANVRPSVPVRPR